MPFDTKKFTKTKFIPRTEDVPVPDMQAFFPDGEAAVWRVRGLTGQELGWAAEASERNRGIAAILSGLTSGSDKEIAQAVKDLVGVGGNTPTDIAKRIEHLRLGSVAPVCTTDLAVRLCEVYPIEFYQLTNAIYRLTGQGQMPGKLPPSGETTKSGPASPSATPGGASSTN